MTSEREPENPYNAAICVHPGRFLPNHVHTHACAVNAPVTVAVERESNEYQRGFDEAKELWAKTRDELNQCLQIIITNAGNIASEVGQPTLRKARAIEKAAERAAAAIRALERKP